MPVITTKTLKHSYDVIIVGSGAGGGQSAYTLTLEGFKVLMLEAGRIYDPATETPMFQTPDQAPLRGTATPDKDLGFYQAFNNGGFNIAGEPYTNASSDPKREFMWMRARMLGGRTNHWGRISLRYGPYDFKPRTRDGLGIDWPISMEQRSACIWATDCYRGCSIRANYQSTTVHLPPAMATGNLDLLPNAMAREITLGKDGKASGITFIDKTTGREAHARGHAIIIAASAMESVRLLLNSRSAQFPDGLANSSGLIGKYITDSTHGSGLGGQIPLLENLPSHNEDGASAYHVYTPWWLYKEQAAGKLDFARGYLIQFYGGRCLPPGLETAMGLEGLTGGSYGQRFKEDARRYYGSFVEFVATGAMIPNENCFCEIDPQVKDRWGIPVLRFHWKWSEQETRQVAHQQKTFAQIIEAMDGRVLGETESDGAKAIGKPGTWSHEVGGAIMGEDPDKSVTNKWSQTHDVKNLFIADGATFAGHADKNPTLTILALAWRAADHLVSELKRGNL